MGWLYRLIKIPWVELMLFAAFAGIAASGCAPKDDPFAVGDRATPTPFVVGGDTPVPTAILPWFDHEGKGIVRYGEWDDKHLQLANNMTGYITVHGFDYNVEIITIEQADAQAALLKGDIDIIMAFDKAAAKGWYDEQISKGTVFDLGSVYVSKPDIRIIGAPSLKERAAELVTFYGKVKPGDEAFDTHAGIISSGRIGINAVVAAITYFKNNSAVWTSWMPADVVSRVNTAIADGMASLRNRACIPRERDCLGPVSTATPKPAG